jgi:type II secretory pathway pseudopilin PulG
MDNVEINSRSEFALWAIQRAQEIVRNEGSALALSARDMDEAGLQQTGAALGKAIADAILEVFDGLMVD